MLTHYAGRKMLFGLGMLSILGLTGCAKMTAIVGTEAACQVWKPISWSSKDTDQTIVEVKVNNARREGFCK
jgi:hypothetical protein